MTREEFLARVLQTLESCRIPYMLTGSLASSIHGIPRATQDLDLVIDPTEETLTKLVGLVSPGWYVNPEAAMEALGQRGQFNVIDTTSGWKADLIVRKERPFGRIELGRRIKVAFQGIQLDVASPEDTILAKLEWAQLAGSERQYEDARAVAQVQRERLDRDYLLHWAEELGIQDLLDRLLKDMEASP